MVSTHGLVGVWPWTIDQKADDEEATAWILWHDN